MLEGKCFGRGSTWNIIVSMKRISAHSASREQQSGTGQPNWKNRTLFHGDNLDFLRAMNSNCVHLIATDPPFNKGRDFHATPDSLSKGASFQDRWSWERDIHEEWVDKITDDFPKVMNVVNGSRNSYGDDMGAFLCFMAVRLLEMRRILREDGSIFLHCDPTASHYLKEMMDAIFGRKNFRNEIIWYYTNSGGRGKRSFSKKHDVIFWYSKSGKYFFDGIRDGQKRAAGTTSRGGRIYEKDGKIYQQVWSNGKSYTYCLSDDRIADDVWEIQPIPPHGRERVGYPTQKPIRLYERIIKTTTNEGDVVLDPFAGCATTLVAAERLKRQWVGIDIWNNAKNIILNRLEREDLISPERGFSGDPRMFTEDIHFISEVPIRTDEGDESVPFLRTKKRVKDPPDEYGTNAKRRAFLLEQYGCKCQGCDRVFDDDRYLELDHNNPRSDGGSNNISNRILLCSPCNRAKSNIYTLSGLRRLNKKNGWMADQRTETRR